MNIGTLAVNITATTDKFQKGLNSARKGLSNFVSGIGAAQAAVAAFATYGLASIVEDAIEAGGALYEMTQKTHVSAEALSALHYAADQLESSASAVDSALQFMTKTLGKAAQGADPAIKAFNMLGLDFEKILALSPDKQFLAIIDALHKMPDPAERAAAAQGIFGKGAKELSALIEAGTEAIIEQGDAAAKTGAIISSETAKSLDDAGDSIKAFSDSWAALKTQVVGVFAPAITMAFDLLAGGLKVARGLWYEFEVAITQGYILVIKAIDSIQAAWNALVPGFMELDRQGAASAIDSLQGVSDDYVKKIRAIGSSADNPLAKSAADVSGHVTTAAEEKAASKVEKDAAKKAVKDKKEEEKKIAALAKKQTEQLDELIRQGGKQGPVLKMAGVR